MISDLLIGKTLDEVKKSISNSSYEAIFNVVNDNIDMVDIENIL